MDEIMEQIEDEFEEWTEGSVLEEDYDDDCLSEDSEGQDGD
jgi:hypothetical protein